MPTRRIISQELWSKARLPGALGVWRECGCGEGVPLVLEEVVQPLPDVFLPQLLALGGGPGGGTGLRALGAGFAWVFQFLRQGGQAG